MLGNFSSFCCHVLTFFMPKTLKKLRGHIALGLSVCACNVSVCPFKKRIMLVFNFKLIADLYFFKV